MPAMRRTTRVFGMVKSYDGARVLRSGRRLWPEKSDVDGFYELVKNKNHKNNKENTNNEVNRKEIKTFKRKTWKRKARESTETEIKVKKTVKRKSPEDETKNSPVESDKKYGLVYIRRRKRVKVQSSGIGGGIESIVVISSQLSGIESEKERAFGGVVDLKGFSGFSWFLYTVFRYMTRKSLELDELAGFLSSQPINGAYSSLGLQFLWDPCSRTRLCKFYGAKQFVPSFSLDFSATPHCFMYMYRSMLLRLEFQRLDFVNKLRNTETSAEIEEDDEIEMSESSEHFPPGMVIISLTAPKVDSVDKPVLRPCVKSSRPATRSSQLRNGIISRTIQKRRTPLNNRRSRNPSLAPELGSSGRNGLPFSSAPNYRLRSSARRSSASSLKKVRSSVARLTKPNETSSSCNANLLIIESDKCYREEGVSVMVEKPHSGEWILVIKKNGETQYTHKPENNMKLPGTNRFTHDLLWTVEDSWKLEFTDRLQWVIFKDLYKECVDHNMQRAVLRAIPVPVVREVSGFDDVSNGPFRRPPDYYISTKGDEVVRALEKKTANYDADSQDEEWLKKLNNDFLIGHDCVSVDCFELMIDSFEKAIYCNPEKFTDGKAPPDIGSDFGEREIVEAVYGYWKRKRKQKRSALVKTFQIHKKPSLLPKQPPRKKRSSKLKRQASQIGKSKQRPSFVQAEVVPASDQNALRKVEEAKASAEYAIKEAILKRQRAQELLASANLATYKATMSLRIAEFAKVLGSTDAAVSHILD